MEYTLSLALVDFLPVLFTAFGLSYIARMVSHVSRSHGQVAYVGAVLTVCGGFFKALWKLLMATSGGTLDVNWMEDGLFVWMAPGYTLLAYSVWQTARAVQGKKTFNPWVAPAVFNISMIAGSVNLYMNDPASPSWERIFLSVMVLATLVTGVMLIVFGFQQKVPLAGWLFMANLAGILVLNGLARLEAQPISLQWIEESINTISWLCFAIAARRVYDHTRENFGVR